MAAQTPTSELREAVNAVVQRHPGDRTLAVEASFEVTAAVAHAAAGISDVELQAICRAFDPVTPGDWSNPNTVRRVAAGTKGTAKAERLLERAAADDARRAWDTFVDLMRLAHAMTAVDPLPSRRESARIEDLRARLASTLSSLGIDPTAGPPPPKTEDVTAAAFDPDRERVIDAERFEAALASLDKLVGLTEVKAEITRLADRAWVDALRTKHGMKTASSTRHLVFVGNPGTGKTTVARIVSEVYLSLGIVPTGQLIEVGRADLVAGYVGQTAGKTRDVFATAVGGMMFIDEAYALTRDSEKDFGREALDTLVAEMENHRDSTVVVVAGYPKEMDEFMQSNPGLASRFPKTIDFPDYTTDELVAIAELMVGGNDYELADAASDALGDWLDTVPRERGFGNARLVRNALDAIYDCQAQRLVGDGGRFGADDIDPAELRLVQATDVQPDVLDPLLDALRGS